MEITTDNVFGAGNGTLAEILRTITGREAPRVMLAADYNVVQQNPELGPKIGAYFKEHGIVLCGKPVVLPGGEKVKADSFASAMRTMAAFLDAKIGRDDVVIAMGGGSVLDVAGYAAKQVRGGIKLVRIPTTVAAMIDGMWARRAALDSQNVKDAVSIACDAEAAIVDFSFARTILEGVWRAGFSEAARLALACDAELMKLLAEKAETLRKRDFDAMREVVSRCLEIRRNASPEGVCEWAALRLETMSGYKLPHGYATTIGIMADVNYSMIKGFLASDEGEAALDFLRRCGATDGVAHSRHLIAQADSVLFGLDAWELSHGHGAMRFPAGGGKTVEEEKVDRDTMRKALNMIK